MSLENIQHQLKQFAKERDWEQFHSPKNLSMALAGEAAELMEHFQWLSEEASEKDALPSSTYTEVRDELADVFLYTLRLAERLNIDLLIAAKDKMAVNAQKYPVELSKGNATKYNRRDPV